MNKIQTCFLFALIAGVSTLASANIERPQSPYVDVASSFDYGTTYGEFRVAYPGVSEHEGATECQDAMIKIFKDGDCTPLHVYTVPGNRKADPSAFYFAIHEATAGKYQVQVCHGNSCSARGRSFTSIPEYKHRKQLTCNRVKEDAGKKVTVSTFSLDVDSSTGWTPSNIFKALPETAYKQHGLTTEQNPGFEKGLFFVAPMYNLSNYKLLFDGKTTETAQGAEFSDEYCARKYILTVNAHIVDKATKEVLHRFKTTLNPSKEIIEEYILKPEATPVPVIQVYKANLKPGTYSAWVAICATEKDAIESTICSKALEKDLVVAEPNAEAADPAEADSTVTDPAEADSTVTDPAKVADQ